MLFLLNVKALKLSDDLHLNEIECVRLLVSTNQEVLLHPYCVAFLLLAHKNMFY